MTSGTGFAHGEVWSIALAYSGNSRYLMEKTYEGVVSMGVEEILLPGEVILQPGESYHAPPVLAVYSSQGLDGSAAAFHQHVRARKKSKTLISVDRPLTLNLWEAIYFQHTPDRVAELVDVAAELGVERIVLDDGWFSSRRNDTTGLGDWTISEDVWPNSTLDGVARYIASKGIQFGLWFEGEMVNADSNLFRQHPDWVMDEKGRTVQTAPATQSTTTSVSWRHQYVLNLVHPDVFSYLLESISAIISRLGVSYIKWDHNRALANAGYMGRPSVRQQTLALYKLLGELRVRHPHIEIESCASGGARFDFGILDYVDRFWTSDW
jgi:alpha-galactosidase